MPDITSIDATALLGALGAKRISAAELLEAAIKRRDAVNPRVNAVVIDDLARARERARAIDDRRAKGDTLGPLAGLPMTVKDSLDVEGLPASSGLEVFRHRICEDAVAVGHVRNAGAVIWGKTNIPVMTADWQSFNSLYGTTNNPWDTARTPGGSSGGAAAALATGITALEIGSDIGGSLRVPASFCGVYSHKPTWGLVSQIGHVPPRPGAHAERDLNVVGPMARSARDLRLLLSVLENGPVAARAPPPDLKDLRIGLWTEEPTFALDPEVRRVVETLGEQLSGEGAAVTPISSPVDGDTLLGAYRILLSCAMGEDTPPERRAGLERMRGAAQLARKLGIAGPESWASQVLSATATYAEWAAANETRARLTEQMRGVFQRFDVIIAPITPVAAFPHDHQPFGQRSLTASDGSVYPYASMLRWIALATACGLPATAIPAGQTPSGLPVGAQIIGWRGADSRTIGVAEAIDARLGGFVAPPHVDGH